MRRARFAAALLAAIALPVAAAEFKSAAAPAISYDSPSERGRKVSIIRPGTPLEVIVGLDQWLKVRDVTGAINWVERRLLADRRTVLVSVPRLVVRTEPANDAPARFEAVKDVVLELVEAPRFGWIQVRHPDGDAGYARAIEVWGL
ncbi:MAG: hypothetical protein KDH20_04875 [Rhodocyclaceae bacterium]|nr:hypothetical protein [Rhodocyclaceae bacterium]